MGDRLGAIDRVLHYFDSGAFESELCERVTYRTESQKADSLEQLHRYLDDNMIPAFEMLGFTGRKYENPIKASRV